MTTSANIEEWLSIHRELLAQETAFTDYAMRAAEGRLEPDELARRRKELIDLRERCAEAYARAFPGNKPRDDGLVGDRAGG